MMNRETNQRCETCRFYVRWGDRHVCTNTHSEYVAEAMAAQDFCEEWKRKRTEDN